MNTLIHADFFFFVTTIVVILIAICVIIALVYIIKILRTVSEVSIKVKDESEEIINDVRALRGHIKTQGLKLSILSRFFNKIFGRGRKTKKE